jgi:hypothetical protein
LLIIFPFLQNFGWFIYENLSNRFKC